MSTPLRLLLIRHGEVDANREMRYLGHGDPALNSTGLRQADELARSVAPLSVARVLSSPLRRARQTAERIAGAARLVAEPEGRLIEMCFGLWEGLTREQVMAFGPQSAAELARWERDPGLEPPGGESLLAVRRRCLELVDELRRSSPTGAVVLVSHVGPIKALLSAALGVPVTRSRRIFLDPATVSVMDWGRRPVLRLLNAPAATDLASARWARSLEVGPRPEGSPAGSLRRRPSSRQRSSE